MMKKNNLRDQIVIMKMQHKLSQNVKTGGIVVRVSQVGIVVLMRLVVVEPHHVNATRQEMII